MSWRVAKSLEKLQGQLNALFPNRSRVSDGAVGDTRHQKNASKSDHNPWFKDSKGTGIVSARDFTHDPANGLDCNWLCAALLAAKDSRVKYVIWNRFIYNRKTGFAKTQYKGINAHSHHLHLSVVSDPALYDDMTAWNLDLSATVEPSAVGIPTPAALAELKRGSKGEAVKNLQRALAAHGILGASHVDGDFGPRTETAVKDYQSNHGLRPDGIAGRNTLRSLGLGG